MATAACSSLSTLSGDQELPELFDGETNFQWALDAIPSEIPLQMKDARVFRDEWRRVVWIVFPEELKFCERSTLRFFDMPFTYHGKDPGLRSLRDQKVAIWAGHYLDGIPLPGIGVKRGSGPPDRSKLRDSWAVLYRGPNGRLREALGYKGCSQHTNAYFGDPEAISLAAMKCIDSLPVQGWNRSDFSAEDLKATARLARTVLDSALKAKITMMVDIKRNMVKALADGIDLAEASAVDSMGCLVNPRELAGSLFRESSYHRSGTPWTKVWEVYRAVAANQVLEHLEQRLIPDAMRQQLEEKDEALPYQAASRVEILTDDTDN